MSLPGRASKRLTASREFSSYQRTWFGELQEQARTGEPIAVVAVDVPHEVLRAMRIPYVVAPWWASVCASRGRTSHYMELLANAGYPTDAARYSSLGFASSLDDIASQPWGGLPAPAVIVNHGTTGVDFQIAQAWAKHAGAQLFTLSSASRLVPDRRWWETISDNWDAVAGDSLRIMVEEIHEFIQFLEQLTGRRFDPSALHDVLSRANEQSRVFRQVRDLIAAASPAPIDIVDSIHATMIPQWHLGSEWGVKAATDVLAEVTAMRNRGAGVADHEQIRLMWIGNPMWSDMDFYRSFVESHGAVFVWSFYLGIAADGYEFEANTHSDIEALAARHVVHRNLLSRPPYNSEWHIAEARRHRVNGAVNFITDNSRGSYFIRKALEDEGIPVLELRGDAVSANSEERSEILRGQVRSFLDTLHLAASTNGRAL